MLFITNTPYVQSLAQIRKNIDVLSKNIDSTGTPNYSTYEVKSVLSPNQLKSKIFDFQRENLMLEEHLTSLIKKEQLTHVSQSIQVQPMTMSAPTLEPMAMNAMTSEPMTLTPMTSEPIAARTTMSTFSIKPTPLPDTGMKNLDNANVALKDMKRFLEEMSLSSNLMDINSNRNKLLNLNTAFKSAAESQYHLEANYGFDPYNMNLYSNDAARQEALRMINETLATIETAMATPPAPEPPVVTTPPPVDETPGTGEDGPSTGDGGDGIPPISENPIPGNNNGISTDDFLDSILSIKREYNNNQIRVYENEYIRVVDSLQAKANSELVKMRLLEQNNLWLLNNTLQRKSNPYRIL